MIVAQKEKWSKIPYPRTANWWTPGGDWYKLSTWLRENIGHYEDWDYFNETIYIKDPAKAVWFRLVWT
jgi:hypothetical protein